jgi:hypothetical protein
MSGNKIVKMFESIPQFDTFSKYNSSLERIFKNRSFKDFLHSLKNPTKFKSDFDDNKKGEGKFFSDNIDFDDELINEMKSNENEDFFSEKNDLKNKKKNKNLKEIKKCKIIKKKIIIENPDPFKYHPNYKAIYKYVPTVKFTEPTNYISPLKKKEKEFKSESIEKKKTKPKIKIPKIKESILITSLPIENNQNSLENNNSTNITTNNNNESKSLNNKNESIIHNSENQINKSKSQIKIISNNNNLLPPILKSNHALKFSQYTWRKNNIISKQSDKLTYLEPINYLENIDKILDFNKMSSRSEKNLINNPSTLDNPPICYYKPKYNFIERNPSMITFSKNSDNKKTKQFLLRKLWGSYNITSDYQLVDNSKLNANKIE